MKNILSKIFGSKKVLNSRKISFLDIIKKTKISQIFDAISNYNDSSEIRYVGGCVRKILNKENFDDIDLATNINPTQLKDCLNQF